jgi:spore maturation protein CgeB
MPKPEILFLSTADYVERERIGLVEALRSQDATVTCLDRFRDHAVEAVEAVTDSPPDLALHPDTYRVYLPEGIEALDCPTACLHIDAYGGVQNRANMSRLFDLTMICHPHYIKEYSQRHPNVRAFPHAVPVEVYSYIDDGEEYDVAMIGRLDGADYEYRRQAAGMIKKMNVTSNDMDRYYPYEKMVKVYSNSKVTINVSRGEYLNEAHLSCLEIMGAGTLLLTTSNPESGVSHELERLGFSENKHFATFENLKDLRDKIYFYLNNDTERKLMAERAREKTLEKHTYNQRAKRLLKWISDGIPLQAPARGMSEGEAAEIYVDYLSRRGQIDETLTHFRRQRKNRGGSLMRSLGKGVKVTVRGWQRALFA